MTGLQQQGRSSIMATKCTHEQTTLGPDRLYMAPVAQPPYTHEEPRAHGGVVHTETCSMCGAEREAASNQGWYEYSPWGPDRAARAAKARREEEAAQRAQHQQDLALLASHGVRVTGYALPIDEDHSGTVHLDHQIEGRTARKTISVSVLRDAAHQDDPELQAIYSAMLRASRHSPRI